MVQRRFKEILCSTVVSTVRVVTISSEERKDKETSAEPQTSTTFALSFQEMAENTVLTLSATSRAAVSRVVLEHLTRYAEIP